MEIAAVGSCCLQVLSRIKRSDQGSQAPEGLQSGASTRDRFRLAREALSSTKQTSQRHMRGFGAQPRKGAHVLARGPRGVQYGWAEPLPPTHCHRRPAQAKKSFREEKRVLTVATLSCGTPLTPEPRPNTGTRIVPPLLSKMDSHSVRYSQLPWE